MHTHHHRTGSTPEARGRVRGAALVLLLLAGGCGDDDGTPPGPEPCPEGYQAEGPACAPIFDACPGPAEIPVLGGGCQAVGVTACATGFLDDGEGGCTEVLPATPCPTGSREVLGQTTCQPVGVKGCAEGFLADGEGGCSAVLPGTACPEGTTESIGSETCVPLDDCGEAPWGTVATGPDTVHVDQSYTGADADGTAARPFPTVAAGLAAAPDGGQVVVAAGDYPEMVTLSQPVQLAGRCASLVTLRGGTVGATDRPALKVPAAATGSTVQGVTLRGPGEGLNVAGASVRVTRTQILDTGASGVMATAGAAIDLEHVVVARATRAGIAALNADVTLVETVIKATRPQQDGSAGYGVFLQCDSSGCGTLSAQRSVIDATFDVGLFLIGAGGIVRDSVIRGPVPGGGDAGGSWGIAAFCDEAQGCADLEVTGCEVTDSRDQGVVFQSSAHLLVQGTTIRDTGPSVTNRTGGYGMFAYCDETHGCGSLTMRDSSVVRSTTMGLVLMGSSGELVGSQVVETRTQASDGKLGWGIMAQCDQATGACAPLTLEDSLVADHLEYGLQVSGLDVRLARSTLRGSRESDDEPRVSAGLDCSCDPGGRCGFVSVRESVLLRNQSNSLSFNGCSAEVVASAILEGLRGSSEKGDLGGIMVGCGDAAHCGELLLEGSLVARNSGEGVSIWGPGTSEIRDTVLRDQVASDQGKGGFGVVGQCEVNGAGCGLVRVATSVIRGNQIFGVSLGGASLELERSIVRDTEVQTSSGNGGIGIAAGCDSGVCGTVQVTDSLISGNHGAGLFLAGVQSTLEGAHVRGTLPMALGGGMGISAGCDLDLDRCGALDVTDSTVRESWTAGVYVSGGAANLRGLEVLGVSPIETGLSSGLFGHGVVCGCLAGNQSGTVMCSTCVLDSLRVEDALVAGVQMDGATGTARRIVVRDIGPQVRDAVYGYGIQANALAGGSPVTFHVLGSLIVNADLAAVLYSHATGTVSETTVEGADFSVVWTDPGTAPEILESNDLSGDLQDEPSLQTALTPAPAPPPLAPPSI